MECHLTDQVTDQHFKPLNNEEWLPNLEQPTPDLEEGEIPEPDFLDFDADPCCPKLHTEPIHQPEGISLNDLDYFFPTPPSFFDLRAATIDASILQIHALQQHIDSALIRFSDLLGHPLVQQRMEEARVLIAVDLGNMEHPECERQCIERDLAALHMDEVLLRDRIRGIFDSVTRKFPGQVELAFNAQWNALEKRAEDLTHRAAAQNERTGAERKKLFERLRNINEELCAYVDAAIGVPPMW